MREQGSTRSHFLHDKVARRVLHMSEVHKMDMDSTTLEKGSHALRCRACYDCGRGSLAPASAATRRLTTKSSNRIASSCWYVCKLIACAGPELRASFTEQAHATSSTASLPTELVELPNSSHNSTIGGTNNFDLVLFRNESSRAAFQQKVSVFELPGEEWPREAEEVWHLFRKALQKPGGLTESNRGFWPLLAMKGDVPCAAALYSDPRQVPDRFGLPIQEAHNTFILNRLIRSIRDECKGSGAAILCHLILNSKNQKGEFTPLKLSPISSMSPGLKTYFEAFGCRTIPKSGGNPDRHMYCLFAKPQKCKQHVDKVVDAESYFAQFGEDRL
eukprot:gnl/TRDRNA2_/TRDRNA2_27769_c0_seq1.p1 gnl/TRDRNA2_/TRDRNA2_27769_c0~~gnl/TRDRNA2_/TRDRNA2_27769_c0_seq1.p1  ORF type:complete len:331 (+),score=29.95 gnl/TRDRNA2_/TRDRNA2_27769_c0_seq1:63-1055(+)